jgi:methionyl-tRNA formyltransferase
VTRAVFLGTPDEAVPALSVLRNIADVNLVITRPDRPRGRSARPQPSAVKEAALAAGLPVAQPDGAAALTEALRSLPEQPEVGLVVAFGMLLRPEALQVPRRGHLNLHFSLLPRWRGASPVTAALLGGDKETGVSLMQMDEGLDRGPVLASTRMPIPESADRGSLSAELADRAAALLSQSWEPFLAGDLIPVAQDESNATYAPKLGDSDRRLRLDDPPEAFVRRVRAFGPRPGAYLFIDGARHKVLAARVAEGQSPPGSLEVAAGGALLCGTGGGVVELLRIQLEGRRPMNAADWLRGRRPRPGSAS